MRRVRGLRLLGVRSKLRPTCAGDHMCFSAPNLVAPAEPSWPPIRVLRIETAKGAGAGLGLERVAVPAYLLGFQHRHAQHPRQRSHQRRIVPPAAG